MEPLLPGDPREVGEFTLSGRLGEGGMGQVFLGASPTGQQVAVKLLKRELAEHPEFRTRFAREVAAARQISGPHTAQVVAADADANPPWLATEYIAGDSLQRAIRRDGPLSAVVLRGLGYRLAEGLAAIHAAGLIHRDLKPGNVIMAVDGPRIIDFGIARALESSTLTATGTVLGTFAFMAPEQIRADTADAASDVFALGCLLAYAATGASPFEATTIPAVMHRVMNVEPDLSEVPEALRELVAACLAKEPGQRPSVAEVLARLALDGPEPGGATASGNTAAQPEPPEAVAPTRVATGEVDRTRVWPGGATVVGPNGATSAATTPGEPGSGSRPNAADTPSEASHGRAVAPPEPAVGAPEEAASADAANRGPVNRVSRRTMLIGGLAAIASAATVSAVALWPEAEEKPDRKTRKQPDPLHIEGNGTIYTLVFGGNGAVLAAYVGAGTDHVQLWDVKTGERTARLAEGEKADVTYPLSVSPDGDRIALGFKTAQVWDVASDTKTASFDVDFRAFDTDFSPNGRSLAVGDSGGVSIYDVASQTRTAHFGDRADMVAFSPDGTLVAGVGAGIGTRNGGVWRVSDGERVCTLPDVEIPWNCRLAFAPDGKTVAIADNIPENSPGLTVIAVPNGDTVFEDPDPVSGLAYRPNGEQLVLGSRDGVIVRGVADGERIETIGKTSCDTLALSPDGELLAMVLADEDDTVVLRRL